MLVIRDPYLRPLALFAAAANLALTGYAALVVVFLVRVVKVEPGILGLLLAVSGAGGVISASIAGRVVRRLGTARGLLLSALCGLPFALLIPLTGPGPRLAFFVAGVLMTVSSVVVATIILSSFRQVYCPPELLGGVVATMRFLLFGSSPLGALLGGGLGTWLAVRDALWVLTADVALSGTLLLTRDIRGRRDLPTSPASPERVGAAPVRSDGRPG